MPELSRPDGATIHWEQRGAGPALLVFHGIVTATPSTFDAVLDDLAADHRVVTVDPRGAGRSSRARPYDRETDTADAVALIEEIGEPVVAIAFGWAPLSLSVAETRRDYIASALMLGTLGFVASGEPQSLLDSDSVSAVVRQLVKADPRALQRTVMTLGNPQLSEAELHARLEAQRAYCPVEVWLERADSYLDYDTAPVCEALGDRLWLVHWPSPLAPGRPIPGLRERLPEAHFVEIEDGPISRPDLSAAVVREATAALRPS
ncbi:MAG TPA: alpha/beta hydrolase [Thermoleophilaceae bacterium]